MHARIFANLIRLYFGHASAFHICSLKHALHDLHYTPLAVVSRARKTLRVSTTAATIAQILALSWEYYMWGLRRHTPRYTCIKLKFMTKITVYYITMCPQLGLRRHLEIHDENNFLLHSNGCVLSWEYCMWGLRRE
jgi:hypothetical protein